MDGIGRAQYHGGQADIFQNDIRNQIDGCVFITYGRPELGHVVGEGRQIRLPLDAPDAGVETRFSG